MTLDKEPITAMIKLASQLSLREMRAFKVLYEHMIIQREQEELANFKREVNKDFPFKV